MNDTERLEAMDSYFNRYRRLKSKLVQNEQDQEAVRAAYVKQRETLQERRARMTRELENMRKVMTKMIDDGSDPVMANLSIGDGVKLKNPLGESSLERSRRRYSYGRP